MICQEVLGATDANARFCMWRIRQGIRTVPGSSQGVVCQLGSISAVCAAAVHCCHAQAEGTAEAGAHQAGVHQQACRQHLC